MGEFIQIMRFRTDDLETLKKHSAQYREDTAGRSTFTSETLGTDLDTGETVLLVRFPSKEAADANNELPETQALGAQMASYVTEGPSFTNIEVIETVP